MPNEIELSEALQSLLTDASVLASIHRNKLVTPEHILLTALNNEQVVAALRTVTPDVVIDAVIEKLRLRISGMDKFAADDAEDAVLMFSYQYEELMKGLAVYCSYSGIDMADVPHLLNQMVSLKDSYAANCLQTLVPQEQRGDFLAALCDTSDEDLPADDEPDIFDIDVMDDGEEPSASATAPVGAIAQLCAQRVFRVPRRTSQTCAPWISGPLPDNAPEDSD